MTILAFGGGIASGKSFLSQAAAQQLRAPRVSFGQAVRAEAAFRGLHSNRAVLQDLGDELISRGWDSFCELVVQQAPRNGHGLLIVDGVRHLAAIDSLCRLAEPDRLVVVFVEASYEVRLGRLKGRNIGPHQLAAAEAHPNEAEVDAVRLRADIVVRNDDDVPDAVIEILESAARLGITATAPN